MGGFLERIYLSQGQRLHVLIVFRLACHSFEIIVGSRNLHAYALHRTTIDLNEDNVRWHHDRAPLTE